MKRERLRSRERFYKPEFGEAVYAYALKYFTRHVWRVAPEWSIDDLMQEAYIWFVKMTTSGYVYHNPEHFMYFWKLRLKDYMNWLSRKRTLRHEVSLEAFQQVDNDRHWGGTDQMKPGFEPLWELSHGRCAAKDDGYRWERHLKTATGGVLCLLYAVRDRKRRPCKRFVDGTRLTTNQYLCRFAGISDKIPLRRLFDQWLGDA